MGAFKSLDIEMDIGFMPLDVGQVVEGFLAEFAFVDFDFLGFGYPAKFCSCGAFTVESFSESRAKKKDNSEALALGSINLSHVKFKDKRFLEFIYLCCFRFSGLPVLNPQSSQR